MSDSDERLDALLAQGRLSGPEKDRILSNVLARSAAAPQRGRWTRWLLGGTVALAAAGAAGVVLIPRMQKEPAGFAARGAGQAVAVQIDLGCLEGTLERCPAGGTLLFSVRGEGARGFLGAYARPEGGGEPIWYFSGEAESPAVAASGPELQPLSRGIRLGPEHRPGRYQVVVVVAQTAPGRVELLAPVAGGELARRTFELTVVAP